MNSTNKRKIMRDGKTWVLGATAAAMLLAGCNILGPNEKEPDVPPTPQQRLKNVIAMNLSRCIDGSCGVDHVANADRSSNGNAELRRVIYSVDKADHTARGAIEYLQLSDIEHDMLQAHFTFTGNDNFQTPFNIRLNDVRVGNLEDEPLQGNIPLTAVWTNVGGPAGWQGKNVVEAVAGNGNLREWLDEIRGNN